MFKHTSYDYFQSLIDFADCALSAAEYLHETILHFDLKVLPARMDAIHSIEHQADDINHRNLDHLAREFLPPIEREDLALLSHEMDDVVDGIDDIMRKLCMYGVTLLKPEVAAMSALLVRCCRELKTLTTEFRHFKKSAAIKECIVRINSLKPRATRCISARSTSWSPCRRAPWTPSSGATSSTALKTATTSASTWPPPWKASC